MNLTRAQVVISVEGGIAYVAKALLGTRVLIIDHDKGADEPYYVKEVQLEFTKEHPEGELVICQHVKVKSGSRNESTVEKFLDPLESV